MTIRIGEKKMEMTFEESYKQSVYTLSGISIPDYPQEESNVHADFIELWAMTSGNEGISFGDIQDRFFGETDEDETIEKKDSNESFIKKLFSIINERITQYRDLYPFMIDENNSIMLKANLSDIQKLYLFLLVSSFLDIFKSFNSALTSDFEKISYEAIRNYIPNAVIKSFGKISEYKGTAAEKIRKLAKDIGLEINEYELDKVGKKNNQDRGLDIICWLPFEDNCQNKIVFLCQCACGKNFEYKQHETHRFANYFIFYKTKPRHSLFIPYSLINHLDGKFYHSDYIEEDCLVFERLRILSLLRKTTGLFDRLNSKDIIEKCIQTILRY